MQRITSFFLFCSGADLTMLQKCRGETSKYTGIGATIFFTGLFAALAAGYALHTVFDNSVYAIIFGLLWGLMIFNLDRYIVSSMRKSGKLVRELGMATPRLILAVLISIVIAKPLELKIFEKEIEPELVIMEQQKYAEQEAQAKLRFRPLGDSLKTEIITLYGSINEKTQKRDDLVRMAQEEADGTGGSKKKNLGPIYKIKKADADAAEVELELLRERNLARIKVLEDSRSRNDSLQQSVLTSLEKGKLNGFSARMEALDTLTSSSNAMFWAHVFIMLLFIAIETAPVFVKLISEKGPYDNLQKMEEHDFEVQEIEHLANVNSEAKQRGSALLKHEQDFVNRRLDAELEG
jgi:Domain of unknown function (DUF4407)